MKQKDDAINYDGHKKQGHLPHHQQGQRHPMMSNEPAAVARQQVMMDQQRAQHQAQ
jgi:hypothetical protein